MGSRAVRLQLAPYETLTPSSARAPLEKAMPPKLEIVRYENSQALFQAASAGQFFDCIQLRIRPAVRSPGATAALKALPIIKVNERVAGQAVASGIRGARREALQNFTSKFATIRS